MPLLNDDRNPYPLIVLVAAGLNFSAYLEPTGFCAVATHPVSTNASIIEMNYICCAKVIIDMLPALKRQGF
jgi:hypothetical protein